MKNTQIAILFFSRTASNEAVEKPWLSGKKQHASNQAVAQLLIQHTSKVLEKSPFPVFHFTEQQQKGISFGERFTNAFESLFNQGFESVIAVGNDSPHLSQVDWSEVKQALEAGKEVIGANMRGGSYLIALHRKNFQPTLFRQLPWQTPQLLDALQSYFYAQGLNVTELPALQDLNTLADLYSFLKRAQGLNGFVRVLSNCLLSPILSTTYHQLLPNSFTRYTQCLRAPPLAFTFIS